MPMPWLGIPSMGSEDETEGSSAMLRVHPSWVTSPTMPECGSNLARVCRVNSSAPPRLALESRAKDSARQRPEVSRSSKRRFGSPSEALIEQVAETGLPLR